MSGCNSYLKWVGLHQCKKPIRAGPSLAGLPGKCYLSLIWSPLGHCY